MKEVPLWPLAFLDISKEEIVEAIATPREELRSFIAVNAHAVHLASVDAEFAALASRHFRFCDGFGVHLLCVVQGLPRPRHRATPTDFMWDVFARLHAEGKTAFLVGDEPGVAERFAERVNGRFPGLVVGCHHGFFAAGSSEEENVLTAINAARPHLLCVGMGQPRQEKWVERLRDRLPCPAAFHIGASMAFAVGARRRGPRWATDHGLEWLFRVLAEPRKMFSRYFLELPALVVRSAAHRQRAR